MRTRRRLLSWLLAVAASGCTGVPAPSGREQSAPVPSTSTPNASATPSSEPPGRVVLITVDGLSPDAYRDRPGVDARMPQLARWARTGVSVDEVVPVVPASSYPAHATMVTGDSADRHGIVGDRLLGKRGVRAARYWHASRLKGRSLWQAAREARRVVVSLGWPSTLGAAIDLLLPDIVPTRAGETWVGLLADSTTAQLFRQVKEAAARSDATEWPQPSQRDALLVDLACRVAESKAPPALWLIHLSQTRRALVRAGPGSRAADAAFARVDADLARLVDCFRRQGLLESTAFVVAGDHGFSSVHTQISPNVLLREAGLIAREPPSDTVIRNWTAIALSHGGSAFVYANAEPEALEARRWLADEAERTRAFRVISAAELQLLHGDPQAWFGLAAEPGFVFGDGIRGPVLSAAEVRGAGGYLPGRDTTRVGLAAWGPGFRREIRVPKMHQVDLAPTLAALLGLKLGEVEGGPMVGILSACGTP